MQRLELKAERDSVGVVEEILNASITEALEEREQQETSEGQHTLFSARLYSIYNFFYFRSMTLHVWKCLSAQYYLILYNQIEIPYFICVYIM